MGIDLSFKDRCQNRIESILKLYFFPVSVLSTTLLDLRKYQIDK